MEPGGTEPVICTRFYTDDRLSELLHDLSWELIDESTIRDIVFTQDSELDRWHVSIYQRVPSHAVSRAMLDAFNAGGFDAPGEYITEVPDGGR